MAQILIDKFRLVNEKYEEVITIAQEAFVALKQENRPVLKERSQDVAWKGQELECVLQELTQQIESECEARGIEKKIPLLVTYYTVREKEAVLEELRKAIQYDRDYKNQLMMVQTLAQIKYETAEALVEVWSYIAQEDGLNGQMFVNQKF